MRIAQKIGLSVAIAAQVVLASGCTSPVPPTVTRAPTTPLKADPAIFLQAGVQRPRVAESLRNAGVRLTETFSEADYILNVNVGRRRKNQACGGSSNVAYILDGRDSHVMVIKGRGLTGTCAPNVFDNMSQKLATYFGG
jgi:hypothetical protein